MGIKQVFQDALKKVTASKDQGALEHARSDGLLGPTTEGAAGAFEPLPPPPGGGSASGPISGGGSPPIDVRPIKPPPSQPTPPKDSGDQGPIEGGGGGTPPPPSAPFDPNQVTFHQTAPGGPGAGLEGGPLGTSGIFKEMDGASKDLEDDEKLGNFEIQDTISDKEPPPPPPPPPPIQRTDPAFDPGKDGADAAGSAGGVDLKMEAQLNSGGVNPIVISRDRALGNARLDEHGTAIPPEGFDKLETSELGDSDGTFELGDVKGESTDIKHIGTNSEDRAPVEGGDTPEFGDISDVPSRRGPLVQVEPDSEGGGTQLDPNQGSGGPDGDEEAIRLERGDGETAAALPPDQQKQIAQDTVNVLSDAEHDSADGEATGLRRPPGYIGETEENLDVASSDPEEGGEVAGGSRLFDIKLEEVVPSSPGGVPIPYPNVEDADGASFLDKEAREDRKIERLFDGSDDAEFDPSDDMGEPDILARPKGDGPIKKFEEIFASSTSPEVSEPEDDGLADALARKAGEGQKDFLKVTMKEAFISRTESDGIDGESMDKDHKGEVDFARGRGELSPEPPPNLSAEELARKAGEGQKEFLDIKLHDVLVSSVREDGEEPDLPEGDDDGFLEGLAHKTAKGEQPYLEIKLHDVLVSSVREDGSPEDGPDTDDDGLVDALARKAGEGQKDFLVVKMQEAFISREADDGVDGESTTKDHTGEMAFGRRTEVKDANDRYANVESRAVDDDYPDDDDFESSALLDLKADTAVKEMLPGLAGELPDDMDIDLDGDDVDADTDESEL